MKVILNNNSRETKDHNESQDHVIVLIGEGVFDGVQRPGISIDEFAKIELGTERPFHSVLEVRI